MSEGPWAHMVQVTNQQLLAYRRRVCCATQFHAEAAAPAHFFLPDLFSFPLLATLYPNCSMPCCISAYKSGCAPQASKREKKVSRRLGCAGAKRYSGQRWY